MIGSGAPPLMMCGSIRTARLPEIARPLLRPAICPRWSGRARRYLRAVAPARPGGGGPRIRTLRHGPRHLCRREWRGRRGGRRRGRRERQGGRSPGSPSSTRVWFMLPPTGVDESTPASTSRRTSWATVARLSLCLFAIDAAVSPAWRLISCRISGWVSLRHTGTSSLSAVRATTQIVSLNHAYGWFSDTGWWPVGVGTATGWSGRERCSSRGEEGCCEGLAGVVAELAEPAGVDVFLGGDVGEGPVGELGEDEAGLPCGDPPGGDGTLEVCA